MVVFCKQVLASSDWSNNSTYGYDLVKTNFAKVVIVFVYTVFALVVFLSKGMVYSFPVWFLLPGTLSAHILQ